MPGFLDSSLPSKHCKASKLPSLHLGEMNLAQPQLSNIRAYEKQYPCNSYCNFLAFSTAGTLSGPKRPNRYAVRTEKSAACRFSISFLRLIARLKYTYRKSNIPPSHSIPIGKVNHLLIFHNIARDSDMPNISKPKSNDIVPDDLGFCSGV